MHFSASTAATAAGVLPVFLIAYLLELQRIRLTKKERRRFERALKHGGMTLTVFGWLTVLSLSLGAAIVCWLLVVIQAGGVSGLVAGWTWGVVVGWIIAPTAVIAMSMLDARAAD
jgi:hypothetical protein